MKTVITSPSVFFSSDLTWYTECPHSFSLSLYTIFLISLIFFVLLSIGLFLISWHLPWSMISRTRHSAPRDASLMLNRVEEPLLLTHKQLLFISFQPEPTVGSYTVSTVSLCPFLQYSSLASHSSVCVCVCNHMHMLHPRFRNLHLYLDFKLLRF